VTQRPKIKKKVEPATSTAAKPTKQKTSAKRNRTFTNPDHEQQGTKTSQEPPNTRLRNRAIKMIEQSDYAMQSHPLPSR
jgi:hypothetical protein